MPATSAAATFTESDRPPVNRELSEMPNALVDGSELALRVPARLSLLTALSYPLRHRWWPLKILWMALFQYVPVVGQVALVGWQFDVARRVGRGDKEALPDWRHIGEHLGWGLLLWLIWFVYLLPMWAIIFWRRAQIFHLMVDSVAWLVEWMSNENVGPFWHVLEDKYGSLILLTSVILFYPPLAYAFYEAGAVRFAQTGKARAMFNFWKSARLLVGGLGDFFRIEMFILLLNVTALLVSLLLWMTGVGTAFIPPIVLPVYTWTRGALTGQLIAKLNHSEHLQLCKSRQNTD